MNWKREYHAITILVPDGRVIAVGGEGQPGNEPPKSVIEAFSPPYLFRGIRPELSNFNKTGFKRCETIEFEAQKTNALTKVVLVSNAVMTHFMNSGNSRCLELDFAQNGSTVAATLPADSLRLMPGFYMLFGMVDDIPSVAKILKIEAGSCTSATGESAVLENGFRVFPNPSADGFLNAEIDLKTSGKVLFELTDVAGKTVQSFPLFEKTTEKQAFSLKMAGVPAGIYFLAARLDGKNLGAKKVFLGTRNK